MFKVSGLKDGLSTIAAEVMFQVVIKHSVYKLLEDKKIFSIIYNDMKNIRKSLKRENSNKKTTLVNIFKFITNITGVNISTYAFNTKKMSKYKFDLIENVMFMVCDIIGEEMAANNRRYGESVYLGDYAQEMKQYVIGEIRKTIL